MKIIKYDETLSVDEAVRDDEPLFAVILFDGSEAIVSHADVAIAHYLLLQKTGRNGTDIYKYFRIVFDKYGADWIFDCPVDYRDIPNKIRRIAQYCRDGIEIIMKFLAEFGYFKSKLNVPKRYRRYFLAHY